MIKPVLLTGALLALGACGAPGPPEPVRDGITAAPVRIDLSGSASIGVGGRR